MMQLLSRNAPAAPLVLLQHSFVTTGRVGGRVSASALEHCGCDVSFSSTVTLSRHPGLGPPAGGPRATADLADDAAHAGEVDAIAIGYAGARAAFEERAAFAACLLYPSDAADDMQCGAPGGRRHIKHKTRTSAAGTGRWRPE